jgi:Rrf2 family protein
MVYLGSGVEYGLHCLLWLAVPRTDPISSRELADLQGVPAPFLAKIFPKLQKAGIVKAGGGIKGGYRLAKTPEAITVLDVVDAIEGRKSLFECQEVRARCALYGGSPPAWAMSGLCGIHATMLRAERAMRDELARTTLASLVQGVSGKAPPAFAQTVENWLRERSGGRERTRIAAVKVGAKKRRKSLSKPD